MPSGFLIVKITNTFLKICISSAIKSEGSLPSENNTETWRKISAPSEWIIFCANFSTNSLSIEPVAALAAERVRLSEQEAKVWSRRLMASRMAPSDFCARKASAGSSYDSSCSLQIFSNLPIIPSCEILLKSYLWQRDKIVTGNLLGSVVAKIKITFSGGSSRVLSKALKAPVESM